MDDSRCLRAAGGCPAKEAGLVLRSRHKACEGLPVTGQTVLERKELLHIQGQRGEHIYPVVSGYLRESVGHADGRSNGVRMVGPGQLIGAEALLGQPYATTVDALTTARLCRIPAGEALKFLEAHPEHAAGLARALVREVLSLRQQVAVVGSLSADERVLLGLKALSNGEVGEWIELPVTRRDFADLVNLAHTTASRAVRRLARRGRLEIKGKRIRLISSGNRDEDF